MSMQNRLILSFAAAALLALPSIALADTVVIAANPNALTSNFGQCLNDACDPGSTATVGYTITTSDNGTSFIVALSTTDPNALPFANLYFDTIASTSGTGSNLGFEASATGVNDAFDPNTGTKYTDITTAPGSGFSSAETNVGGTETITVTIPNTYFLTDPDGFFAPTPAGTLVSLHLSQSFGYSVVGGSGNFAAPVELGDAIVNVPVQSASPVPEPAGLTYMALSGFGLLAEARRRLRGRKNA
jgi:hypothetical protein